MTDRRATQAPRATGFTLVELLAVIAIIVILMGIVLVAAGNISGKRKVALTQDVLGALDRALDEYHITTGVYPAYKPDSYQNVPGESNQTETYLGGDHAPRPDAAVFIRQARGVGAVDAVLAGIPDRFLMTTVDTGGTFPDADDPTPSVVDAWAVTPWPPDDGGRQYGIAQQQVVYYVHPANDYAQDLYGRVPPGGRPYFVSAGPDMKYGLLDEVPEDVEDGRDEIAESYLADNVYSYPVDPFKRDMGDFREIGY
jgi:prepilin-type N-terminal cleavage/methylation domain-containing protein